MKKNKLKAFSVMEIIIALIVVTVIAGSFIPALTKKMTTANKLKVKITTNCDSIDEECSLCKNNVCYACSKVCKPPSYKDTANCECVDCTIENCLACDASGTCTKCAAGYYLSGGTCVICPDGKYQNLEGQTECKSCPENHSCTNVDKIICLPGYGSNPDEKDCTLCSDAIANCAECSNTNECVQCKPGYYLVEATKKCELCPIDNKCPDGTKNKLACPRGAGADQGSEECGLCKAAITRCQECTDLNTCTECELGAELTTDNKCEDCPAGEYRAEGMTACATCVGNTYQPNSGQTECYNCPSGTEANAHHTGCDTKGCTAGTYMLNDICHECDVDYYCTGGTAAQKKCNYGYGADGGASVCDACTDNHCKECSYVATCTECELGYYLSNGDCKPCQAGHSCNGKVQTICPVKKYQPNTAQSTCLDCENASEEGMTECPECAAGYYKDSDDTCRLCSEDFGSHCTACNYETGCLRSGCVTIDDDYPFPEENRSYWTYARRSNKHPKAIVDASDYTKNKMVCSHANHVITYCSKLKVAENNGIDGPCAQCWWDQGWTVKSNGTCGCKSGTSYSSAEDKCVAK